MSEPRTPPLHRIVTVAFAVLVAGALVVDTVVFAMTGQRTVVTDGDRVPVVVSALLGGLLGALFAALAWTVHRERRRFDQGNRVVRAVRRPLTVGLAALAFGIGLLNPVEQLAGLPEDGLWRTISSLVALAVLIVTQLSALTLGLATLRHNPLGLGARVLALVLPAIVITVLLAVLAPQAADPAYVSLPTVLGVALLGVRARATSPVARPRDAMVGA